MRICRATIALALGVGAIAATPVAAQHHSVQDAADAFTLDSLEPTSAPPASAPRPMVSEGSLIPPLAEKSVEATKREPQNGENITPTPHLSEPDIGSDTDAALSSSDDPVAGGTSDVTVPVAPNTEAGMVEPPTPKPISWLDIPIASLIANPATKRVLDRDLPGLSEDKNLPKFQKLTLRQFQPLTGGQLTDALLKKVETDLQIPPPPLQAKGGRSER
jgi:hypothetical protein